jgi:transcription initiation factor IIE alpha subunit
MARTKTSERLPPYIFYTCPGCDKRGSVMFMLESLPYDFTCSECGMPTHLYRKDDLIILTFDHPDWAPVATEEGK